MNAYIYPISARVDKNIFNPYLNNFMDSVKNEIVFLNRYYPSNIGLFDILRYLNQINYVFFHWPENIAERKYGLIQTMFLLILLPILRLKKIQIIYILHNKVSHTKNRYKIKKLIAQRIAHSSKILITHSGDGEEFIKSLNKKRNLVFTFPHPVVDERPIPLNRKDIDILIWGNIAPYKGIHTFLELLRMTEELLKYKITIAGKVSSGTYLNKLSVLSTDNVEIIDQFIEDEKLKEYLSRSKIVLFPYHPDSILSSGAFAKSVVYPVIIIGPDCGSFRDFNDLENVETFSSSNEMINLLNMRLSSFPEDKVINSDRIIDEYSWEKFGINLLKLIR